MNRLIFLPLTEASEAMIIGKRHFRVRYNILFEAFENMPDILQFDVNKVPIMELEWNKCVGDLWCPLLSLNLEHSHFLDLSGIYVIWHSGEAPQLYMLAKGELLIV